MNEAVTKRFLLYFRLMLLVVDPDRQRVLPRHGI